MTGPEDGGDSNAVFLDIEPGGSTEYEHTVRDGQALAVEARQGRADLEIFLPTGERIVRALEVGGKPEVIVAGGIYRYVNTRRNDWSGQGYATVHDRSRPAWLPDDEVHVERIDNLDGRVEPGDYLVVWNPAQAGQLESAGPLRLAILEECDTTAYNRAHADQAKFRGQAPHKHAMAQRVGEQDIWPVVVFQDGETLSIAPHRQAPEAIIGSVPEFVVQPDRIIFARPR